MTHLITNQDWEFARKIPKINTDVYLIAHLAMLGKRVVCPGLARSFGERLLDAWAEEYDEDGDDIDFRAKYEKVGFSYHENHARSQPHESFQEDLPEGIIIPIEEACQLAANDPNWDDNYASITRLVYPKEDILEAIDRIFNP